MYYKYNNSAELLYDLRVVTQHLGSCQSQALQATRRSSLDPAGANGVIFGRQTTRASGSRNGPSERKETGQGMLQMA